MKSRTRSPGSAAPPAQQLTLWSGIAPEFTNDLIQRFNSALAHTHIDLRTTSGGVVVVSAVDGGQGQLGLAQSDVVYLAYRRGIEHNLYPHKNLRAIAVLCLGGRKGHRERVFGHRLGMTAAHRL